MIRLLIRILEFVALFFGIPLLIYLDRDFIHPTLIILPVLVFIFLILKRTTNFQWKELVRWKIPRKVYIRNGIIVIVTTGLMLGYVILFDREHLFDLPRANPLIYIALCIFYPVFSAFGQEIIYRTFLFHRYRILFKSPWLFVIASGITFSFVHIVYYDPVSMILTLIGGLYLATVYHQTRSVLFTAVLHGIFGIISFGVGLGRFFWLDMPV